ncbi:hypothetical protein GCM10022234_15830 [Aeromicrobium panaciterrae]|uniref:hypothetical protein n=1 Tax=Aeromicrobium panaciterrae TaxID=363861 RepID=UPI0031D10BE6
MSDLPNPLASPLRGTVSTTVTLFGDNDEIDRALSAELGRRGCRTHAVSVDTGWLTSAANVICRLDTVAGKRALEGLVGRVRPPATVIAMCERPVSAYESRRIHDMCEECGRHHDVSLIWHSAVDATDRPPLKHLAVSVADEVSERMGDVAERAFTSRYVDLS